MSVQHLLSDDYRILAEFRVLRLEENLFHLITSSPWREQHDLRLLQQALAKFNASAQHADALIAEI